MRVPKNGKALAAGKLTRADFQTTQPNDIKTYKCAVAESAPSGAIASAVQLMRCAYHESGHAVAYVVHRIPFDYVAVEIDGSGYVNNDRKGRWADAGDFEDECVCLLAGAYAEARMVGRGLTQRIIERASDDFHVVDIHLQALMHFGFCDTAYGASVLIEKRTREFVAAYWLEIMKVAGALLNKPRLSLDAVRALVGDAA